MRAEVDANADLKVDAKAIDNELKLKHKVTPKQFQCRDKTGA